MKRRRRSLRISQDLETCGETFGSVWKEPSPESCRVAKLKEKRRRSKILNAEELLPFKVAETQSNTTEVEHLNFLNVDIQTTPLSEVEGARCPDRSIGDQDNLGITPVNITEDVLNPSTEKSSFIDDTPRSSTSTPLPKIHPEVFSTPLAPPHLSDLLPYSPSQPILADISQSQESSSLVSPCSPASDVEFFTPMSHMKSHPSQNDILSSRKTNGTKFKPKQLAAEYSNEKMDGMKNKDRLGDSAANFAKVCKSLGEKLLMLKKTNSSEEKTTQSLTGIVEEDVGFERKEENSEIDQSLKTCISPGTTDINLKTTKSPQKTMDSCVVSQSCDKLILETEQNEEPLEHLLGSNDKYDGKDIQLAEFSDLDLKPCLTSDIHCLSKAYSGSPQHSQDKNSEIEEKSKTLNNNVKNVEMQEKGQPRKRGRPRKTSTDLPTSDALKQVVSENLEENMNCLMNIVNTNKGSNEASVTNLSNLKNVHACNEMQNVDMNIDFVDLRQGKELDKEELVCNESEITATDDSAGRCGTFSPVLKRHRGRPRKKSLDSKLVQIGGNSASHTECDVKTCEDGQQQEELLANEKKSRKLRRKSLYIFKASLEVPCSTELREDSAEDVRDFNSSQLQKEPRVEEKKPSNSQDKALENLKDFRDESCKADLEEDSMTETGNMKCQNSHLQEELKRKEKKPRKSLETLKDCKEEPCKGDIEEDSTTENGNVECGNSHQQDELIAAERKSRRLRRRSFEIYKASREEPSEIELKEESSTEDTKDFGNVLKDLNGTTAPAKAPRKRKKSDSEEDIVKIYTSKNYVAPQVKALETISESPTIAKQARKLKRMIEFGSLYHVPPIKQKKRQQKAVKRGWDQRKLRKNKISDDIAQQKLQNIWNDLDKD
ncbi:uncharacterized protein LOC133205829 [Saccostrea echinata]|uniref:uncharacterized protein LOC133205829 n=1 Tax=Saccostrea echinata TaxID=191078 RepID=UPI002A82E162|nr:uncharacterized protein LOC133205829 [Saccostrea echinata]XP_061197700.1 uncharacterized protein LOC133205829 [Saccostrea echinata]